MSQPFRSAYCINPDCPRHYPKPWENKFCNSCGSPLRLKNRYIPLQRLGAGGFATIYTVWDLATQTERVLKVLVEPSPKALELFEQEAAVLAGLRHPGVPRVERDGYFQLKLGKLQERSLPCLVMEKIDGQTLEEVLTQHPQGCSEEWVISWLTCAVDILQELHSRQIIHRDIKPSNLMLRDGTGQLVVIDLGGAKQIGSTRSGRASSTRLFSCGYSPPEQIAGRAVGPAADFYALGRTMIQLLTGKHLSELEDPVSGKLLWRTEAPVSQAVADLLDEMVQEDARQRPTTAISLAEKLANIAQFQDRISFSKLLNQLIASIVAWSSAVFTTLTTSVSQTALFLFRTITQLIRAGVDTIWGMVLGVAGACVGTLTGFILAYWSPVGTKFAIFISQQLSSLVPGTQITIETQIILFAGAGLGTALGITVAGGFGQRRRYLVAALIGGLGYGLGWLALQVLPDGGAEPMIGSVAVAVAILTLGLGLPSHHLFHSVIAAVGCATVFASLATFNIYPVNLWHSFSSSTTFTPGWYQLLDVIAFFSTLGAALSLYLGISYYLLIPLLRFLGWR